MSLQLSRILQRNGCLMQTTTAPTNAVPFALRQHIPADSAFEGGMGENSSWTWAPKGDLKPEELAIYATGGNSTTQRTGMNQYDHGEWQ